MTMERVHTYCPNCVSRCGVVATVKDGVFTKVETDPEHPNATICIKGSASPQVVYSPDRLRYPMKRTRPKGEPDPGWVRISWDEALDLAASRLLDIKKQYGAEAVVFGRPAPMGSSASDYVGWLFRLANAFGSPNLMATTHICQWHKDQGSMHTYGTVVPSPDFERTKCILLWGHNPNVTWSAHALGISRAKKHGAKIIVVDPHRSGAAAKADAWLRVRPGADGALALAMINVVIEENLYDDAFVREWTNGPLLVRDDNDQLLVGADLRWRDNLDAHVAWDETKQEFAAYRVDGGYSGEGVKPALSGSRAVTLPDGRRINCRPAFARLGDLAAEYSPERSESITWVSAAEVRNAARLFATELPSCYYSLVGVEQHTNAMQTNRAICLLFALTGQFDAPGSNVHFPKAPTNLIVGKNFLPKEQASRRLGYAERPLGAAGNPGNVQAYELYRAAMTGKPYPVRAMVMFGGNVLLSNGDTRYGKAALESLDFYLHVDLFPNPSADLADLLLPACSSWEGEAVKPTFDMGEATSTWMQLRKVVVPPQHESRPDLEIIFALAKRLGYGDEFWEGDLEAAFNHQLAPSGITVEALRASPAGIRFPSPTRHRKYAEVDPKTGRPRGFQTPSGKVEIYSLAFAKHGHPALPVYQEPAVSPYSLPRMAEDYPLILCGAKITQFCNTQQRNIPMLRKQAPDPIVEIHPGTAADLGIVAAEWVILETVLGGIKLKVKLNPSLHPSVVFTQHGWWQSCSELGLPGYDHTDPQGANANLLVPNDQIDPISGSVPHRSYLCRVRKVGIPRSSAKTDADALTVDS